jgi:DNA-binding response OmpR family regulator
MRLTIILAVGLDSSLLVSQRSIWKSEGYLVTHADDIREAIERFKNGDFDLVLLGPRISADTRERLAFLIRASGSKVPVVCIAKSSNDVDSFADATITAEPAEVLPCVAAILAEKAGNWVARSPVNPNVPKRGDLNHSSKRNTAAN